MFLFKGYKSVTRVRPLDADRNMSDFWLRRHGARVASPW
jgi:hypothetical protein